MKTFIRKYQIAIFFILTLLIGWLPWYTGYGSIIIAAPSIAAFLVAFLADGLAGVKAIIKRMGQWRANWRWYLLILFIPVILYLAAIGVHLIIGGTTPLFPLIKENPLLVLMTFIFFLIPWQSSAFLEEIGFRGYAQEKLQSKYGPLVGTLILGTSFGAWLLPEFFQPDSVQFAMGGLGFFPWFVLTEIGWSMLMAWVFNQTNRSALIAGYLFHTAFNAWTLILLTNAIPGEPLPLFDVQLFITTSLVVMASGIAVGIATKGKLGFSEKSKVESLGADY